MSPKTLDDSHKQTSRYSKVHVAKKQNLAQKPNNYSRTETAREKQSSLSYRTTQNEIPKFNEFDHVEEIKVETSRPKHDSRSV